jgi:hypothetical protein
MQLRLCYARLAEFLVSLNKRLWLNGWDPLKKLGLPLSSEFKSGWGWILEELVFACDED